VKRGTFLAGLAGAALLTASGSMLAVSQQREQRPEVASTHLKVGDEAPDFTLASTAGGRVTLSDFRGKKNVVLAFYVLAFTGG